MSCHVVEKEEVAHLKVLWSLKGEKVSGSWLTASVLTVKVVPTGQSPFSCPDHTESLAFTSTTTPGNSIVVLPRNRIILNNHQKR